MSAVTYPGVTPDNIRTGDTVERNGETFIAYSDAEWVPSELAWNVLTDAGKYRAFSADELVTVTYSEDSEYDLSY